ncbi:MAG: DNA-3-methyladenine glycosylase [bacterium]
MTRLGVEFYDRPARVVARDLLGKILARRVDGVVRRARVIETEAYVGEHDLASHARFGRTPRNASMWGPPGRAYVYLVYGMHHCLNVVTSAEGDPQAVLLRAAEALDGWEARLGGPALLAKAFGLTRKDDGADLLGDAVWLQEGARPTRIATTPRIGVGYAGTWANKRLRFAVVPQARNRRPFKPPPPGRKRG